MATGWRKDVDTEPAACWVKAVSHGARRATPNATGRKPRSKFHLLMECNVILPCKCSHKAQDQFHGFGNRVFNPDKTGENASCTVCGAQKGTGKVVVKAKPEAKNAS